MDIIQKIRNTATIPIPHQYMISLLRGYKRPNDKIHDLIAKGILTRLKKGIYIAGPIISEQAPTPYLIANHLLGPSYVSVETALSFYGLIPEQVFETVSMTTKAKRSFVTPVGKFSYIKQQPPYFSVGITQQKLAGGLTALFASEEKALFDQIVTTSKIRFRSQKESNSYLFENLRIAPSDLKNLDIQKMTKWLEVSPKKESLSIIIESIKRL